MKFTTVHLSARLVVLHCKPSISVYTDGSGDQHASKILQNWPSYESNWWPHSKGFTSSRHSHVFHKLIGPSSIGKDREGLDTLPLGFNPPTPAYFFPPHLHPFFSLFLSGTFCPKFISPTNPHPSDTRQLPIFRQKPPYPPPPPPPHTHTHTHTHTPPPTHTPT